MAATYCRRHQGLQHPIKKTKMLEKKTKYYKQTQKAKIIGVGILNKKRKSTDTEFKKTEHIHQTQKKKTKVKQKKNQENPRSTKPIKRKSLK